MRVIRKKKKGTIYTMEKKLYVAPNMKVRNIESEQILAASTKDTGISDTPATGGGRAKSGIFSSEDGSTSNNNIWGD